MDGLPTSQPEEAVAMAIHFACTCGKKLRVADDLEGKRVRCPSCKQAVAVPALPKESIMAPKHIPPRPTIDEDDEVGPEEDRDFEREPPRARRKKKKKKKRES